MKTKQVGKKILSGLLTVCLVAGSIVITKPQNADAAGDNLVPNGGFDTTADWYAKSGNVEAAMPEQQEVQDVEVTEHFVNGDFEAEIDYSGTWYKEAGHDFTLQVEDEGSGNKVLHASNMTTNHCFYVQVNLEAGTTYTISYDIKTSISPGCKYHLFDGSWGWLKENDDISTNWETRTFTYKPTNAQGTLIFQCPDATSTEFYIDNFSVTTELPKMESTEHFVNGDFEAVIDYSGTWWPDTGVASSVGRTTEEDGNGVLGVKELKGNGVVYGKFIPEAGNAYEINFKIKTTAVGNTGQIHLWTREMEGTTDKGWKIVDDFIDIDGTWKNYSFPYTPTSENVTEVHFLFHNPPGNADNSFYIDDFSITTEAVKLEPKEHFINGDFEAETDYSGTWWGETETTQCNVQDDETGNSVLHVSDTVGAWNAHAKVHLETGKTYQISYRIKASVSGIQYNLFATIQGWEDSEVVTAGESVGKEWETESFTYTCDEDNRGELIFQRTAGNGDIYIDNFSITTMEMPTTYSEGIGNCLGAEPDNVLVMKEMTEATYKNVSITAGKTYEYSYQVKTDKAASVTFAAGTQNVQTTAATSDWTTVSGKITAEADATEISFVRSGVGNLLIDDVAIYEVEMPDNHTTMEGGGVYIPTGHRDLFTEPQGTFEDASNTGCVLAKGKGTMIDGMAKLPIINNDNEWLQTASVNVEANKEYTFSAYVYVTGATGDLQINLYTDGAGSKTGAWIDKALDDAAGTESSITTNTEGWQLVQYTWTPQQSGPVYFGIKNYGTASTATVYVDDFALTTVKEKVKTTLSKVWMGVEEGKTNYTLQLGVSNYKELVDAFDEWNWFEGEVLIDGTPTKLRFNLGSDLFTTFDSIPLNVTSIVIPAGTEFIDEDGSSTKLLVTENELEINTVVVPDNHTTMEGGGVYIPTGHKNLFVEPQGTFEDASNAGCVLAKGKGTMTDGMAKLPIINNDNEWLETARVNVEANKEYTFSAYVYVTGATGDLQINLYTDGAGSKTGAWIDKALDDAAGTESSITTNTEGWRLVQYTWTPQQSGTVYFGIKNYGTASTATVYVDDFALTTAKDKVYTTISAPGVVADAEAYRFALAVSNYSDLCTNLGEWSWLEGKILINGELVTVGFNLGSNTFTTWYDATGNPTTVIPLTATSIEIPAGTEFVVRGDSSKPVLLIENDLKILKLGQGWGEYQQVHEYVDNGDYADAENVRYYNISNGDYLITSFNNAIEVEEDKTLTTGSKITVNDLKDTNVFHISRLENEELWKETVVLYIPGDANEDEAISAKDLVAMKWAETKTSEKQNARLAGTYASDLDGNRDVNDIDLRAMRLALVSDDAKAELAVSKSDSLLGGEMPIAGFDMPRDGNGSDLINDAFYKLIADAHINTIVWSMDAYDQAGYGLNADKHMALADKWGLKMWVHDYSTDAASTDRFTQDNFAKRVGAYSMYESFAGIHIVDEPDLDTNWLAGDEPERKLSIFKNDIALCNSTANISGYMNLLPYYPHLTDAFPDLTVDKYKGYLAKTYTDTKAEMLSVDHYPFRVNDTGIIIDKWTKVPYKEYLYKNLDMMRMEANKPENAGKPFWSYAQLTLNAYENHKLFDDDDYMTAGEVQWQVNTALALGARGIQYWSVYAEPNYSEMAALGYAGLINPDGTKSNYYDVVQNQNSFIKVIDEVLMNATNEGIFVNDSTASTAFSEINSGVVLTDADSDVLKSVSGDNALVGCFDYYGKTAFYVVNCNTETAQNITLTYDNACQVAVTKFTDATLNRTLSEATSSTTISVGAGQAALVIVE